MKKDQNKNTIYFISVHIDCSVPYFSFFFQSSIKSKNDWTNWKWISSWIFCNYYDDIISYHYPFLSFFFLFKFSFNQRTKPGDKLYQKKTFFFNLFYSLSIAVKKSNLTAVTVLFMPSACRSSIPTLHPSSNHDPTYWTPFIKAFFRFFLFFSTPSLSTIISLSAFLLLDLGGFSLATPS